MSRPGGGVEMFSTKDPVCGVKVDRNTAYAFQCGNKVYYFDSQACKDTFKDDPGRFVQRSGKGFLAWLKKGSKDVPRCCHDAKNKGEA